MKNKILTLFAFLTLTLTVIFSKYIKKGIITGINICGTSLIPSLFPVSVISLFILYYILPIIKNKKVKNIMLFLITMCGGFPIGSKILGELYENKCINNNDVRKLKYLLINAGPGFIITFIGKEIFNSFKIGLILFLSQIITTVIFLIFSETKLNTKYENTELFENAFLKSISESTSAMISVCSVVILFSGYTELLNNTVNNIPKEIIGVFEITNYVKYADNVLLSSFFLSWNGICVHLQVLKMSEKIKIKYIKFIVIRLLHGIISTGITYLLLKIFKTTVKTNTYTASFGTNNTVSCIFLILTMFILFFTLSEKNMEN